VRSGVTVSTARRPRLENRVNSGGAAIACS
jgi:hypothetical protein